MERNYRQIDTERTRIMKNLYRPSSNLVRFFKSIASIVVKGESPISNSSLLKNKSSYIHH